MSVRRICRSAVDQRSTASATKAFTKSSLSWKKFAKVSRSTISVGASSQTSHFRSSTRAKAPAQCAFQPGKCSVRQSSGSASQSAASEPSRYDTCASHSACLAAT